MVLGTCLYYGMDTPVADAAIAVKGADVSWVPAMEYSGCSWYNKAGVKTDVLKILRDDYGMNTVRLRVFVNPSGDTGNGWCDKANTVAMARRAKALGLKVIVDFHYSDSWADPAKQTVPSAWTKYSLEQLYTAVYGFTKDVMNALVSAGVTPAYAQVGNETNDGMLWPYGKASSGTVNMKQYAGFVTSGYNAVKAVSGSTKVIVHLANADQTSLYTWNIGGLVSNGAKFDVVGMSLYPTAENYTALLSSAAITMNTVKKKYGKDVMIMECGMSYNDASTCKTYIQKLISQLNSLGGLGVLYWEPEAYSGWNGYSMGAWAKNGKASVALDGFK
jgi:arabinogalactan endo-1,4-beta-galactosidase